MKAKKSEKKIKIISKPPVKTIAVKKVNKIKLSAKPVKTDKANKQPVKQTAPSKVKNAVIKKKPVKALAAEKAVKKTVNPSVKKDIKKIAAAKKTIVIKTDKKTSASKKPAKIEKTVAKVVKVAEDLKTSVLKAAKTTVKPVKEPMLEPTESAPELPGKRKVGRPRKIGSEGGGTAPRPSKREVSQDDTSSLSKNDTMKVYMQDIGQISLVTKEEEVELAAKIHGTDMKLKEEARATLIKANLRLVVKIAHDFKGLGLPLLDLISEGNIGLMRAVEKFDPAKGAKFSSYAAWWIKQSMRRALANQSKTIRIPVQSAGKINKIKSARLKLTEKLGREPTDAEIAGFLEFSERTVAGLRLADLRTFSLHDPIQQGEDGEFQDIIPDRHASIPDRILGDLESVSRLTNLMESLDEREKMILKMRFGLDGNKPRTLEEVSQEIGRTRERVRQIQNQALTKLKSLLIDESGFVYE